MKFTCYLEDSQGREYRVVAYVVIEPAQYGGLVDPSWNSSWSIESVRSIMNGNDITETLSVEDVESLNNQVTQQFEDIAKDFK